ncbi:glycoside hydrolase family 32 protein [Cellulomonas sp. NTE-D12]|uniref:glycoside hydrolase family 32 protein n=1 Tax=Cellulomonas sp. NTE-D12 TaxID=2962632 RepID=UPI0030818B6A|nr:beta-fructosidase levanase/invertase [Cellulomonas sp. NTE-D12]
MSTVLRPSWHFTTADRWLNDPNGLVFHDGTYHLFFQSNPFGPEWGEMSWGHATSTDLVHWTDLGTAIPALPDEMVFSGSAVVDTDDTAGFGAGAMVAVYTSAYRSPSPRAGVQAQSLAVSNDEGLTWRRYEGNPVLDVGASDFRDPYVFWHEDHWVMVVAESVDHRLSLYTSRDLRSWAFSSTVGPAWTTEALWECPALLTVPTADGDRAWVLLLSVNPGGPTGGSASQYVLGDFDGYTFVPDGDESPRWLDYGHDYYAAVAWGGVPDGRALTIAWADSWQYARDLPSAPWRGAMSLVRQLDVVTGTDGVRRLRQRPVLGGHEGGGPAVTHLRLPCGHGTSASVRLLDDRDQQTVVLTVDGDAGTLSLDRSGCGEMPPAATAVAATAPLPASEEIDVTIIVDGSVVEVFAADGTITFCERLLATSPLSRVEVREVSRRR